MPTCGVSPAIGASVGRALIRVVGRNAERFRHLLGGKGLSPINASPQDLDESYRRFVELMDKA